MDVTDNGMPNIMLGSITHNGLLDGRMARAFYSHASQRHNVYLQAFPISLLAAGCNLLWCHAINLRERMRWKYLAILHADIVPEDFWLDKLVALADEYDADVMSAIVPIKDYTGATSTAISRPKTGNYGDDFNCYKRLTQTQVNDPAMPATFDIDMLRYAISGDLSDPKAPMSIDRRSLLLVNTGCCVIRCDRDWCVHAHFTINDRLVGSVGNLSQEVEPEDWFFSRRVAELGGRVMATRLVKVEHIGKMEYHSDQVWGRPYG